jgi:hypothetical protein
MSTLPRAHYRSVLTLTIPKREEAKPKQIKGERGNAGEGISSGGASRNRSTSKKTCDQRKSV